jgi:hypothetical protein
MSTPFSPGPGSADPGSRLEEAIERMEMELRLVIAHVNDTLIPQVRQESISAMRSVAGTLSRLADRFEQQKPRAGGPRP